MFDNHRKDPHLELKVIFFRIWNVLDNFLGNFYLAIAVNSTFCFIGGAAGGGYSQVIPMEEVCIDLFIFF